jgi:hypothetical protein
MSVDFELNWSSYKEIVAGSKDKSLELFATRKVGARLNIDLNQHTSMSQAPMSPVGNDQYEEKEIEGVDYFKSYYLD